MRRCLGGLCILAVLAWAAVGASQERPRAERSPAGPGRADEKHDAKRQPQAPPDFTPQREAAALEFVRRHHPELATLLAHLKNTESAQYRRAISALFRSSEHLAQIQEEGNPEQYARELKAWKLNSRIQLLVARVRIAPEDETQRLALKQALYERSDMRRAQLVEDRKRLTARLKKVDARIAQTQNERDAQVERQLELLLRGKRKPGVKPKSDRAKTPAAAKPRAGAPGTPGAPRLPQKPGQAAGGSQPAKPSTKPAP